MLRCVVQRCLPDDRAIDRAGREATALLKFFRQEEFQFQCHRMSSNANISTVTSRPKPDRGRLSYRVGSEQAERCEIALEDDSTVSFGRGDQCDIRIGHAPIRDVEVPRVAGWLVVAHGRVIVEAAPMPQLSEVRSDQGEAQAVRRALQVSASGGPPVPIAAGSAYSPAVSVFTVEVTGATQTWELDIVARSLADDLSGTDAFEPHTHGVVIDLTDEQREVLLAYAEPVLAGGVEPATHDQVAARVYMSRSQVRRHLERLSDEFYDKRLWSPESGDTRVRVVEAARHNHLLAESARRLASRTDDDPLDGR
jgi:hypothetical protein